VSGAGLDGREALGEQFGEGGAFLGLVHSWVTSVWGEQIVA
jgi:hypothetical protein